MKISMIISQMSNAGGTERVMSIISSEFIKHGHEVTIITVSDTLNISFYLLDPKIQLINTNILGKTQNCILKFFYLPFALYRIRNAVLNTKPDILISFVDILNVLSVLSLIGTKIPIITTEHFSPGIRKIGIVWEVFRRITYRYAKAVTVLTPQDKEFFPVSIHDKIFIMPNPATRSKKVKTDHLDIKYELIAVGRLVKDKGFDILIKAFSIIEKDYPLLKLNIYGSGVEFDNLCDLIGDLNLENRIFINKPVCNILEKMITADIFIHPARLETFGMVIVEAMAAGVPVIATDCPYGPRNIINDGINGLLVKNEDPEDMSKKIKLLFTNAELRKMIGKNAEEIVNTLSVEKYIEKWEKII